MDKGIMIISHASDIDGVGSADLISIKYGVDPKNIFFSDYSTESLKAIKDAIKKGAKKGTSLFITDLGVNGKTVPIFKEILRTIKHRGGRVFWFDHHPWSSAAIKELTPLCDISIIGENELFCATEITRKELGLNDKFSKYFCRIVHFSDFAIRPRLKKEYDLVGAYALSIALYRMQGAEKNISGLRHIVRVLTQRRLLDKKIRADANAYRKINDRNTKKMLKDVYLGDDIAMGFAGDIQKTYACMKLMEKTGKDIGIYVNTSEGRGHMRSVRNELTELANRFGGGGHPHASGFTPSLKRYNKFRTAADKQRLLDDIERELKEIQKNNKSGKPLKASKSRTPIFG